MKIWFDMDGTLANLYAVEGWLDKLRAYDPTPYADAVPLLRLCTLARALNRLSRKGVFIGIVSWLSKTSTPEYDAAVTLAKMEWLKKHLPSVKWDAIKIVPYGTPKSEVAEIGIHDVLFDDEEDNLMEWDENGGWGLPPAEMMDFLRSV